MALLVPSRCKWLSLSAILWCFLAGAVPAEAPVKQINGSSLFGMDDITDVPSLLARLQGDSNPSTKPVSQFIWGEFDPTTKQLLADPNLTLPQREPALVQELNKILRGKSFYERARFAGVALRPETQSLVAKNPAGERLILVNRLLLEDAYPLEIARNRISYMVSSVVDEREGLYRHDVVVRGDQDQPADIAWQDHASELRSFQVYKSYLLAIGAVGTSSESVSVINLTDKQLSDFFLCREPIVSPSGRYISYLQFVPRHTISFNGRIPDITLVFDVDASTNDISGIGKDEGWVSLAANKGMIVYPQDFLGKRVFPVPTEKVGGDITVKARGWAADTRRLFVVMQQGTELRAVSKDVEHAGKGSLKQGKIDLRDVLGNMNEAAVSDLKIEGFEGSNDEKMVVLLSPGPNVKKDRVAVDLR